MLSDHATQIEQPLSAFHLKIVQNIASQFVTYHGERSAYNGKLLFEDSRDSMKFELDKMLFNPRLGMLQVVPTISFWLEEFDLKFNYPLFNFEQQRLQFAQAHIDELEALVQTQKKSLEVRLTLLDILLELDHNEIEEALPLLEEQINDEIDPPCVFPKHDDNDVARLECLLNHSDHTIDLILSNELFAHHHATVAAGLSEEERLDEKAKEWLNSLDKAEKNNLQHFIKAYKAQPHAMQQAIDRVTLKQKQTSL